MYYYYHKQLQLESSTKKIHPMIYLPRPKNDKMKEI